jgi:hypothetical protein
MAYPEDAPDPSGATRLPYLCVPNLMRFVWDARGIVDLVRKGSWRAQDANPFGIATRSARRDIGDRIKCIVSPARHRKHTQHDAVA